MSYITDRDRPLRYLIVLLFVIYILMIPVWVVFFKSDPNIFFKQYWQTKVFADTEMLFNFTQHANIDPMNMVVGDLILNVIAFIPFGVYLEILYHEAHVVPKALTVFFVSLFIEVLQFSLQFGSTDIVDLISNTLGGVIGIVVMRAIYSKRSVKAVMVLALIFTVLVGLGVAVHTVNAYFSLADYYNSEAYEAYLQKVQEYAGGTV